MTERSFALVLCAGVAATLACATPYRDAPPSWWPQDRVRVVYLCCIPKDESRIVPGMIIPKFVATERIVAADYPPAVQAQETAHKRKSARR